MCLLVLQQTMTFVSQSLGMETAAKNMLFMHGAGW